MQSIRFNHVFLALLLFCACSAFLLPRYVGAARAPVQNIYFPVSRPTRLIVQWLLNRVDHRGTPDAYSPEHPRSDDDIRQENLDLHQQVLNLTMLLQKMEQVESQRAAMGDLRNYCVPFKATGGDTGTRLSLFISGTKSDHLAAKMGVVFPGGVVGQLAEPGPLGTTVRLMTDRGFRCATGVFKRFGKDSNGKPIVLSITSEPVLATGAGDNTLIVSLDPKLAKLIHDGDLFVLDDSDWKQVIQGLPIGRVVSDPKPPASTPGSVNFRLRPTSDLMQLKEVMVVTKG